ncbi:MAG: hypothetical protein M2R45_04899 [Verrucomicrobia subdivision 3 bacterium]|nr:hypothetical protein [Limisphaerales bacterium]MCS1417552.1 hypothetical protein [Limisphaerales bacterium]
MITGTPDIMENDARTLLFQHNALYEKLKATLG